MLCEEWELNFKLQKEAREQIDKMALFGLINQKNASFVEEVQGQVVQIVIVLFVAIINRLLFTVQNVLQIRTCKCL